MHKQLHCDTLIHSSRQGVSPFGWCTLPMSQPGRLAVHRRPRRPALKPDLIVVDDGPVRRLTVPEQEVAPSEHPLLLFLCGAHPVYLGLQGPALALQPGHILTQLAGLVLLGQDLALGGEPARGLKGRALVPGKRAAAPLGNPAGPGLLGVEDFDDQPDGEAVVVDGVDGSLRAELPGVH